jgi:hypothetical protein
MKTSDQCHKVKYEEDTGFIWVGNFHFSPSFRSVSLDGKLLFNFTKTQARIIDRLVEYLERGFDVVPQFEIKRHLNDERFSDEDSSKDGKPIGKMKIGGYFKNGKRVHPAWQTLIKTTRGRDSVIYLDLDWARASD